MVSATVYIQDTEREGALLHSASFWARISFVVNSDSFTRRSFQGLPVWKDLRMATTILPYVVVWATHSVFFTLYLISQQFLFACLQAQTTGWWLLSMGWSTLFMKNHSLDIKTVVLSIRTPVMFFLLIKQWHFNKLHKVWPCLHAHILFQERAWVQGYTKYVCSHRSMK